MCRWLRRILRWWWRVDGVRVEIPEDAIVITSGDEIYWFPNTPENRAAAKTASRNQLSATERHVDGRICPQDGSVCLDACDVQYCEREAQRLEEIAFIQTLLNERRQSLRARIDGVNSWRDGDEAEHRAGHKLAEQMAGRKIPYLDAAAREARAELDEKIGNKIEVKKLLCTYCGHSRSSHQFDAKTQQRGRCKDCAGRAFRCKVFEPPIRRTPAKRR